MSGDDDVDTQIMLLETPFGDGPHVTERERAANWLLTNAERAYPRMLARLEAGQATVALIQLLPRFARNEDILPLSRLMAGSEALAWSAAQALALHPQAAAGEILRNGLAAVDPAEASLAADGLATRGDPRDCKALTAYLDASDAGLRYHVTAAAAKLGCLSREMLHRLSAADPDPDVRGLARKLHDEIG